MPEITKIKELSAIFDVSVNDLLNCNSFQEKKSEEKKVSFSSIKEHRIIHLLIGLFVIAFVVFFICLSKGT